ncbi:MAG: hypothetical protein ABIE70_09335 [bacterium]
MYSIKREPFGFHLTFAGHITADEMQRWADEFILQISRMTTSFSVFVDMRDIRIVSPDAQPPLRQGQEYARNHGMVRSVVILSDDVIRMQFRKIARQTGIIEWERYIDASVCPDWEQLGMDWILLGRDPESEDTTGPTRVVTDSVGSTSSAT